MKGKSDILRHVASSVHQLKREQNRQMVGFSVGFQLDSGSSRHISGRRAKPSKTCSCKHKHVSSNHVEKLIDTANHIKNMQKESEVLIQEFMSNNFAESADWSFVDDSESLASDDILDMQDDISSSTRFIGQFECLSGLDEIFDGMSSKILGDNVERLTNAYNMSSRDEDEGWDDEWFYMMDQGPDYDFSIDPEELEGGIPEDLPPPPVNPEDTNVNCQDCPGCVNCQNCVNCVNCTNCINCQNCTNCNGCIGCNDCINCTDCKNCNKCSNCKKCNDCTSCTDCFDCTKGCSKCKDCSSCHNCSRCTNCKNGCSNCSKCSGCKGCNGCSKCQDCSSCTNCKDSAGQNFVHFASTLLQTATTAAENCKNVLESLQKQLNKGVDSFDLTKFLNQQRNTQLSALQTFLNNALGNNDKNNNDQLKAIQTYLNNALNNNVPMDKISSTLQNALGKNVNLNQITSFLNNVTKNGNKDVSVDNIMSSLKDYLGKNVNQNQIQNYLTNALKNNVSMDKIASTLKGALGKSVNMNQLQSALSKAFGNIGNGNGKMNISMDSIKSFLKNVSTKNINMTALKSSLKNALDKTLPKMTVNVMDQILYENEKSLPLFQQVFSMVWSENKQWVPSCFQEQNSLDSVQQVLNSDGNLSNVPGVYVSEWMVPKKETPEYFDYVQLFFGGPISNMTTKYSKVLKGILDPFEKAAKNIRDDAKQMQKVLNNIQDQISQSQSQDQGQNGSQTSSRDGTASASASSAVSDAKSLKDSLDDMLDKTKDFIVKQFPKKVTCNQIPNMSISKQVMDLSNMITKLNTLIKDCSKEVLKNIKELEASELQECSKSGNCNKSKCCGGGGHCNGKGGQLKCTECKIPLVPGIDEIYYNEKEEPFCEDCFLELYGSSASIIIAARGKFGSAVGGTVGGYVGGYAGAAVGGYFGGPIGATVGKYAGEYVGGKIGAYAGDKLEDQLKGGVDKMSEKLKGCCKGTAGCSGGGYGCGGGCSGSSCNQQVDTSQCWSESNDGLTTKDLKQILDVMLQSEYVVSNMSTCSNKIITFYFNLAAKKFSEACNQPLQDILSIWKKVCEIVPPLNDLKCRCDAIPTNGDCCTNAACNQIMPTVCNIVKQYVKPACECAANIAKKCQEITQKDFLGEKTMNIDIDASLGNVGNAQTAVA